MSRSGKNLIQIRGHRSQDKLRSSICLLFLLFSRLMILSNVFFIFTYPSTSLSFNILIKLWFLLVFSFRSWFSFLIFVTSVFTFLKNSFKVYCKSLFNVSNLKSFQELFFFHFSSFKRKSLSTRLIEWQERIANKRLLHKTYLQIPLLMNNNCHDYNATIW